MTQPNLQKPELTNHGIHLTIPIILISDAEDYMQPNAQIILNGPVLFMKSSHGKYYSA